MGTCGSVGTWSSAFAPLSVISRWARTDASPPLIGGTATTPRASAFPFFPLSLSFPPFFLLSLLMLKHIIPTLSNTWEPRRSFLPWNPAYDEMLKKVWKKKGKGHQTHHDVEAEARKKNDKYRKEQKTKAKEEARRMAGNSVLTGGGEKKKKAKAPKTVKVRRRSSPSLYTLPH